jgi:arginyl-tRNA synthetase
MTVVSTLSLAGLEQWLECLSISGLNIGTIEADPLINPLDICRSSLAQILSDLTACDIQDAFKSIQWPNNIYNGDLSVTIPRLRPGCKPEELSAELVDKVGSLLYVLSSETDAITVPK